MVELRHHLIGANLLLKDLLHEKIEFSNEAVPGRQLHSTLRQAGLLLNEIHTLLELPDELYILTSERLFDEAISKIHLAEQTVLQKPELKVVMTSIKPQLNIRIKHLSEMLITDLQNPALKKREATTIIQNLHDLGFASKAREVFLDVRKKQIESSIFDLRKNFETEDQFLGNVNELALVVFTQINSTIDEFRNSFAALQEKSILSGLIVWVMSVLKIFNNEINQRIFSQQENFEKIGQTYDIIMRHQSQLEAKGLSVKFSLELEFQNLLAKVIENFRKRMDEGINTQFHEEKWQIKSITFRDKQLTMTDSGHYQFQSILNFSKVMPYVAPCRMGSVMKTLLLLDKYFFELSTFAENIPIEPISEFLGIVANAQYLCQDLLDLFSLEVPVDRKSSFSQQIKDLQSRINVLYQYIKDVYCSRYSESIVNSKLQWFKVSYNVVCKTDLDLEPTGIRKKFTKFFAYLSNLFKDGKNVLGEANSKELVSSILQRVIIGMSTGPFWTQCEPSEMFSEIGIEQFKTDFLFMEQAAESFLTPIAKKVLGQIETRALEMVGAQLNSIEHDHNQDKKRQEMVSKALTVHQTLKQS